MPSIQEMQSDMQTAQAHGDTQLAQHIQGLIQQASPQPKTLLGATGALADQFVHNIPLVGDASQAATAWASHALTGNPVSWDQANAEAQAVRQRDAQNYPIDSVAGAVLGAGASAAAGGAGLRAAGVLPRAMQVEQAATLAGRAANVGRLAVAGATAGGVQGAAQSGGEKIAAGQLAQAPAAAAAGANVGAAAGAVLGPVAGAAAAGLKKVTAPLAGKTAQALAKVFGEAPDDLQAAWSTFMDSTGRAPTMAELATLKQRGEIANAAKDSTPIAATLTQAADDAARARSDNMQTFVQQNAPTQAAPAPVPTGQPPTPAATQGPPAIQSSGQVQNATTATGDVDYAAARKHNFTIPTDEGTGPDGVVSSADHLASQVVPLAGLKTADKVRIMEDLKNGQLSGQDAQLLDSKLGAAQGVGSGYSPAVSSAREDLSDILASPGNDAANAALGLAKSNYTAGAQRAAGAAHGETVLGSQTADNYAAEAASKPNANSNFQAGTASGARSKLADEAATPAGATSLAQKFADDDSLHAKLQTTFGAPVADAFRRLGQSESAAADNLRPFAKRTPQADDQDGKDLNTGLRALAATASHGVYQVYHGAKAIAGLGMSPQVQEKVAQYLADPEMTTQGINLLRKAGATNAQLRQLALHAAQSVGAVGGQSAASATEQ